VNIKMNHESRNVLDQLNLPPPRGTGSAVKHIHLPAEHEVILELNLILLIPSVEALFFMHQFTKRAGGCAEDTGSQPVARNQCDMISFCECRMPLFLVHCIIC
jgi:hypothetical protein